VLPLPHTLESFKRQSKCCIAEALDELDAYDPKTVVRVNGLRALSDDNLSIVAGYFKHFGSVKRKVPVVCEWSSGKRKRSNFGFIVMSCTAEVDQILAHDAHVVDGHKIRVRAHAARQHKRTVRVKGLRALGEEGLSIVARYLHAHFGPVIRKVPVSSSGQALSNFGFFVMRLTGKAEQSLAHNTHIVDCHEITVRIFAVAHAHRSTNGNRQESNHVGSDACQIRRSGATQSEAGPSHGNAPGCAAQDHAAILDTELADDYERSVQMPSPSKWDQQSEAAPSPGDAPACAP
jgi:hypothetical protein